MIFMLHCPLSAIFDFNKHTKGPSTNYKKIFTKIFIENVKITLEDNVMKS